MNLCCFVDMYEENVVLYTCLDGPMENKCKLTGSPSLNIVLN